MSRQYHYLVAGFPDLLFDDTKLEIDLSMFKEQLIENLHPADFEIIKSFYHRYDNENLLKLIKNSEAIIDKNGLLTSLDWENAFNATKDGSISEGVSGIPVYISSFLDAHREDKPLFEAKSWELQLSELFYQNATSNENTFISNWFKFERDLQNIVTAWQCRKHDISVENQLIGSGEIIEKLSRSNSRDFGLDNDMPLLDQIIKALEEEDLKEFEKKIDRLKWDYLDDTVFFHYFTIEKIFSFLIKISIVERWLSLDKQTGQELFNELLSNMETSYVFPEEFKLKK